jgi:hypothetical protein
MVRNDWEWLEMVGNGYKVSETNSSETVAKSGNGCKWLQMTGNG